MCEDDQHIKLLKGLRGVIDAFYLDDKIKAEVQAEENTVKACGGITVCNLGYMEALKGRKSSVSSRIPGSGHRQNPL